MNRKDANGVFKSVFRLILLCFFFLLVEGRPNKRIMTSSDVKKEEDEEEEDDLEEGEDEDCDQSSPRGVLESALIASDSDQSIISSSTSSIISVDIDEKSPVVSSDSPIEQIWNFLDGFKKRSVKKFCTIPFLGGNEGSKKTSKKKSGKRQDSPKETIEFGALGDLVAGKPTWKSFTYKELVDATDNFSPDKLIGKGGHAEVYKGKLAGGRIVAVKKILKHLEKKNEDRIGEFLSELGIIAHISHPNVSTLIGFSIDRGSYLVLEFAPHGSLTKVLHGSDTEAKLDWKRRFKIAVGVAEGLNYLHSNSQRRIIHRDITASNILLRDNFEPQISDFGLAKWLPENWVQHVASPIEGTFGYMAPEYFMDGIITEKTDVFAFGVLLLEIITGRQAVNSSQQSLVMWAKPLLESNNAKALADPLLGDDYSIIEMRRAMMAASGCLHHLPSIRPNMDKVVLIMKGEKMAVEMRQMSMGGKAVLVESVDMEDYTCATYMKDLDRHMELIMDD